MDSERINLILHQVQKNLREEEYRGIDPYDALNSSFVTSLNSKLLKLAFTQLLVYSPINLRKSLKIIKGRNPKALALILSASAIMKKNSLITDDDFDSVSASLLEYIREAEIKNYSGSCWGFNFDWQDLTRYAVKGTPTVVVTSFVANSLLDLYDITKDKETLDLAISSSDFILEDLNIYENENGICFSYTPIDSNIVHNANLLGAALLARLTKYVSSNNIRTMSKRSLEFSLAYQDVTGYWAYSQDLHGKQRKQIDFHQGFILDSIAEIITKLDLNIDLYKEKIQNGLNYYWNRQFKRNGQSIWRVPRAWPIDIHNQAQGMITFSKFSKLYNDRQYLYNAGIIANWTISEMYDDDGHFYYQRWPFIINKISYLRWSQAWMLLSMANLYDAQKEVHD